MNSAALLIIWVIHEADVRTLCSTLDDFGHLQSYSARPAQHFQRFGLYAKQICVACAALLMILVICKDILVCRILDLQTFSDFNRIYITNFALGANLRLRATRPPLAAETQANCICMR